MSVPSLQDGIDAAGSPINLLWKPGAPPWSPPVVPAEVTGWAEEQTAAFSTAALSDLSHHMRDLFITGPDVSRLLSDVSANNYVNFAVNQAKQFVAVTEAGQMVQDGILYRNAADSYTLTGPPASQSWVLFHGERGGYDVEFRDDPDSEFRQGDPVLFRYQIQGPRALAVVEKVFGGPLPETKFFHAVEVSLAGRRFHALRHGMAGQAGYEFIGEFADGAHVRDALLSAGEEFGLIQVGAKAYATNGVESGWIPTPTPAIYTAPELKAYREWLKLFSFEGQKPLSGSFFSPNIEDYYVSPYELGYGRSIHLDHEFIGRDALLTARDNVPRTKVTLELDRDDVASAFPDLDYLLTYSRHRIEAGGELVGVSFYTAHIDRLGRILALSLVDNAHAAPGTQVEVVWGSHPGGDVAPDADLGFPRLRATVQTSPYNEFARTQYRADTLTA